MCQMKLGENSTSDFFAGSGLVIWFVWVNVDVEKCLRK